jgi:NADH dehydrogenase
MTSKLAVVFGGSGFLGRNVVRELAKRGWRVRVAVRRPHLALHLSTNGYVGQIQLQQANVRDAASVERAVAGADAVVNCVGILFQRGRQKFDDVQGAAPGVLAAAASQAGARAFVHVSAIGASAQSQSRYARSKAAGERAVKAAFPAATIIRPSILVGVEDDFFNRFGLLARYAPALPLIGGGKTKFQPICVDDAADAVCEALARPDAHGLIYEIGGPRVYTFRELMELTLFEIRRKRILMPVPFPVASVIGFFGEMAGLLPIFDPPLTRDQVKLLKLDNIVAADHSHKTIADLGIQPKTIESVLPAFMLRFRRYGQFAERERLA